MWGGRFAGRTDPAFFEWQKSIGHDQILLPAYPFIKNFTSAESLFYVENRGLIFSPLETYLVLTLLSWLVRVPHLYDMHSSLPEQLSNFQFSRSRLLAGAFRWLERLMVSRSASVIVICRDLEGVARAIAPSAIADSFAAKSNSTAISISPASSRAAAAVSWLSRYARSPSSSTTLCRR